MFQNLFGSNALIDAIEQLQDPERLRFAIIKILTQTNPILSATLESVVCLFDSELLKEYFQLEKM